MGVLHGTWRTMFVAFLGLVHKVYACGLLAGLVISTTKVGEFLPAMARLRISKKLTIPIAVMLRYLPTIREDWHFIKDAMRLRDVSPTLWGLSESPSHDGELHLCSAFDGGERQRLSIARAIMKDAPIIILDEATANVDPENEKS